MLLINALSELSWCLRPFEVSPADFELVGIYIHNGINVYVPSKNIPA